MSNEELGLNEKITNVQDTLDLLTDKKKTGKVKPFRLKAKHKSKLKKAAKKNKVAVAHLRENRTCTIEDSKIVNNMIFVNGAWRDMDNMYTYLYEGKWPIVFLPEWDLAPIGTKEYYERIEGLNMVDRGARAQKIIINAIEMNENKQPTKISGKTLLWIGLGAIVVIYVLFAGG